MAYIGADRRERTGPIRIARPNSSQPYSPAGIVGRLVTRRFYWLSLVASSIISRPPLA